MPVDAGSEAMAAAARRAVDHVEDGMVVGLGTGRTAQRVVALLGERARAGLRVTGVPTSEDTARRARAEGIALGTLEEHPALDLAIDGADAVDPAFALVKGRGGALLREKIVAASARRFVVVVDETKLVPSLAGATVPVEVVAFGWSATRRRVEALGARAALRAGADGAAFVTDGGNRILDCVFPDGDVAALARAVKALTGVVDHGWFLEMAGEVVVGSADGSARVLRRDAPRGG